MGFVTNLEQTGNSSEPKKKKMHFEIKFCSKCRLIEAVKVNFKIKYYETHSCLSVGSAESVPLILKSF